MQLLNILAHRPLVLPLATAGALAMVAVSELAYRQTLGTLAQLAPAGETGRWFGLYALSGKATAFMAPLVIAIGTRAIGDQRIAVAVSALFMVAGALVLIRTPDRSPGA